MYWGGRYTRVSTVSSLRIEPWSSIPYLLTSTTTLAAAKATVILVESLPEGFRNENAMSTIGRRLHSVLNEGQVASKSVKLQRPARARNDQPVVDCAYGYQKENQEEAGEVDENCGQEGGADEEGG